MLLSERRTFLNSRGYKYSFIYVPAKDSKPTLLFLHGFPSHADDWERQVAHFAPLGYGVIAPDLLGYGDTSKPDSVASYTFKSMSDDIVEILDHLELEFDLDEIQQMTEKMAGFVMFGYMSWLGGEEDPHAVLEEHAKSAMSLLFAADRGAWNASIHPLGAMEQFVTEDKQIPVGDWYAPAMQDRHLEVFGTKDGYRGATRWYRMLVTNASLKEEQDDIADVKLEQPSLIVADAQSMPPQKGMLAEWVSNLTAKELDSGHWTHIECAEQVNQTIIEFIGTI
ncbi:hypothetical protein LLEC1_02734 [Akanthomyces lecanii]|uniref:AB hydrolase-1 domain-containing protein n=1 Tax=Cordyceps confragosa TaxID=2714763 RepID=A0A179IGN6_CORDF|nr:hypothetical protein LLEC1_02734 [Akanthomyces lecanii]